MIYELRQYIAADGRMEELQSLFGDVVHPLFMEVGIRPVGYRQPVEDDEKSFVYLLAFESLGHRTETWPKFTDHPKLIAAKSRFPDGVPPYASVTPTVLKSTDYSPHA